MAKRVFLDTEFLQTSAGTCFISAAFLAEDDSQLYAERPRKEVEALLQQHPSEFVREQVLPQFGRESGVPWAELPRRLVEWLDGLGAKDIEMVYDFGTDYLLVEQLLEANAEPPKTRLHPTNVSYLLGDEDGRRAADSAWDALRVFKGIGRHHALADAFALRMRFATVHPPVCDCTHRIVEVLAIVSILIPELELVRAESDDGELTLSLGELTQGVDWRLLKEGQRLRCTVEFRGWTRVLKAEVLP
jgi:hypothetical protein